MSDFGRLVRDHRKRNALTQDEAAARVKVSRVTFTQWESGRHLPTEHRVHELDQLLEADGVLITTAEQIRAGASRRPVEAASGPVAPGRPLRQVLLDVRGALLDQLPPQDEGRTGWRHNLVASTEPEPISVLSTMYGLKTLAMLNVVDACRHAVARYVMNQAFRDGGGRLKGWTASSQHEPRLETTGSAFDALLLAGVEVSVDDILRVTRELLDETARQRPAALCIGLEPLLRVAPDSPIAEELVRLLLDNRMEFPEFGGARLWPEKRLSREQPMVDASIAHTARAIAVLRQAPPELVGDSVSVAESWLAGQTNLDGVSERIRRRLPDGVTEDLAMHHFTAAQVVRALAGAESPDHVAMDRALLVVWERFDTARHMWAWGNGDAPVWMLADGVAAVREAAQARYLVPVERGI